MEARSSTSSFDAGAARAAETTGGLPRVGFPWALAAALGLVGLVELGVRAAEPRDLIAYHYGVHEYGAAANHLRVYGPADVSFVGDSRGKEAIAVPEVTQALGLGVRVANYSVAGARADEIRALGDFLLERGTPRVILCGVTPRVFLDEDPRWDQSALYWDWSDWWAHYEEDRARALSVWPTVARNSIGEVWRTLRYRDKPLVLVDDIWIYSERRRDTGRTLTLGEFLAGRTAPSPLNGELTLRQLDDVSLVTRPVPDERVREYVATLLTGGRYPMGERRLEELSALAAACRNAGVPLVFYEIPVAQILVRHKPPDVYPRFYERMEALGRETAVRFIPVDSLGVRFEDADFAEQSHLNLRGATKLTRALVPRALAGGG